MALKNYEIVMVFSLANGEEAVEVLKQKFTDLIAKHGTLGNVDNTVKLLWECFITCEIDNNIIAIVFIVDWVCKLALTPFLNITDGVLRSLIVAKGE